MSHRTVLVLAASILFWSTPLMAHAAVAGRVTHRVTALGEVRYIYRGLAVQPPGQRQQRGRVTQPLYTRYLLKTASGQRASLRFRDGTVLQLAQRTDALLRSPTLTLVHRGEVDQTVAPGTNHRVQTSAAIAAAIGTSFDVRIVGKQTPFIVLEGTLRVSNQPGTVYVKNNQATLVSPQSAPPQPCAYGAKAGVQWTAGLPVALDLHSGDRVLDSVS